MFPWKGVRDGAGFPWKGVRDGAGIPWKGVGNDCPACDGASAGAKAAAAIAPLGTPALAAAATVGGTEDARGEEKLTGAWPMNVSS